MHISSAQVLIQTLWSAMFALIPKLPMSLKSKIIIVITIVQFILGHRVNQFLRCMSITGCGPRTFFTGYFHFLPLAKIPPVVINNSILQSGYYYYFRVWATVAPSLSALPESQMLCAYLLTILGAELLIIPTSKLLLFHPNGVPWKQPGKGRGTDGGKGANRQCGFCLQG